MTQLASGSSLLRLAARARGMVLRPNPGSATGTLRLLSAAAARTPATKTASVPFGFLPLHGTAHGYLNEPYGSFRDFAHYQINALDPAMVLVRSHNGGATTSDVTQTSGYRRFYAIASPPLDYPVSGGKKAWSRAAYASIGLKFKGLVNAGYQFIDGAQFEVAKYAATAPVAYQSARALNCVVVPKRVNLLVNPNFETSSSPWTGATTATVARSTVRAHSGTASLAVTTIGTFGDGATNSGSAYPTIIVGHTYTASCWVYATIAIPVTLFHYFRDATNTLVATFTSVVTPPVNTWTRISATAVAPAGATTTQAAVRIYAVHTPTVFYVDDVLLEEAATLNAYFDGASGPDYVWGGAANASASFYYPDRINRSYLISQLLAENCPLGVTPGVPQFGVLPTQ